MNEVKKAIQEKYEQFKKELGFPIGDLEKLDNNWWKQKFEMDGKERGAIYYNKNTGVFAVYGAIYAHYNALQAKKDVLGFPKTDEMPLQNGRYNHFEKGSIYWTQELGAHEILGAIYDKWANLGWETGYLGYPISNEGTITTPVGKRGRYQHYEHGSIYYNEDKNIGPYVVHEKITKRWSESDLKWEQGALGYPVNDTQGVTQNAMNETISNNFQGGSISWNKIINMHNVTKLTPGEAIKKKYQQLTASLGTSVGDIEKCGTTKWSKQKYQKGAIYYNPETEAYAVYGAIYVRYTKMQSEKGVLGFPKTDELGDISNGGRYNSFENGSIYWTSATGACAIMQIGEISIPFSQSIQEPDLQSKVDSLQSKVDSLSEKLDLVKTDYSTHTHSYDLSYLGGAWNIAMIKESIKWGTNLDYLVHVINPSSIPSTRPTALTSMPK